jgi:alcohol dehydrogenase class IV
LSLAVHPGGEPTLDQLDQLLQTVRSLKIDWIAAVGGGSVLDVAKAAAGLAQALKPAATYFDGAPIETEPLPFLAAPTTAGTGSEATVNAVLIHPGDHRKKSIRDPRWMPRCVILDPNLLIGCPPPVIADSGMDALTQAIEAYASRYATPFSDGIAVEAISLLHRYLPVVFKGCATDDDRLGLLTGSYLGGMALSLARLGVVHGIAHPLGSLFSIPHGRICALCLPLALDLNRPTLGDKYDRLSGLLGADAVTAIQQRLADFSIRSPLEGVDISDSLEFIVKETLASGSSQANSKTVTRTDVLTLLYGLGCRLPTSPSVPQINPRK